MNLGELSVRNDRVLYFCMLLVLLGGLVAFRQLGRLEDPEFTIKEALIVTPYPGASAEEVAQEVTNPIESACQELGQLERVESESSRGMSVVTAVVRARYDKQRIPQVWDELRRKINDVQARLPPSVRGRSIALDDFVYADRFRPLLEITDIVKLDIIAQTHDAVQTQAQRAFTTAAGPNQQDKFPWLNR